MAGGDAFWDPVSTGGVGGGTASPPVITSDTATTPNISTSAATWQNINTSKDVVVADVTAGDTIMVGLSFYAAISNPGVSAVNVDAHTLVSGTRTNSVASAAAVSDAHKGVAAWRVQQSTPDGRGPAVPYVVQAGDIAGDGSVTFRFVFKSQVAGQTATIYRETGNRLQFWAQNMGQ